MADPHPSSSPRDARPDVAAMTRAMERGDEAAYRLFYDAYFHRMLRYLLVVTSGDEQAAREALQVAMIRVARHVKTFGSEEKFWGWLTVLARTSLADESRKRRRWLAFLERFSSHAETETGGIDAADDRLRELLEQNLGLLPADERELVSLKYLSRQSVREIAARQNTSEKAVESRLARIRRKLREAVLAGLKP